MVGNEIDVGASVVVTGVGEGRENHPSSDLHWHYFRSGGGESEVTFKRTSTARDQAAVGEARVSLLATFSRRSQKRIPIYFGAVAPQLLVDCASD